MCQVCFYGAGPGDQLGLYLRYQGELFGLLDPQNRDPRRASKTTPRNEVFGWFIITPSGDGGVD